MNKLDHFLNNVSEQTLKDALRFLLDDRWIDQQIIQNAHFIQKQVDEFAKMFPEEWPDS